MAVFPKTPKFENISSDATFINHYSKLLAEIEKIAKGGNPGLALNEVIYKLMPYVQQYNMEYTQGNIANGQEAASYALSVTNYISAEYQASSHDTGAALKADVVNAMKAYQQFNNFYNKVVSSGKDNPFGSMGSNVLGQLKNILGNNTDPSSSKDVTNLEKFWTESWKMDSSNSSGTSGNGTNSMIMQDINGAQNQAQSDAAYLQSEAKIANEDYQKYAATEHDIAQNIVSVEKAAVSASQSAGN